MFNRFWQIGTLTLAALAASGFCVAAPERLVIVRHGEKLNTWQLCPTGWQRAQALSEQYLGNNASLPLFPSTPPAAILTLTLHTSETAQPTAHDRGMPLTTYVSLPNPAMSPSAIEAAMNQQNRQAVQDLLKDPRYNGKQVLMVWEHFHTASAALEARYPGEQVTLRQLLKLNLPPFADQVPDTWPDGNYNFFWVIDFNDDGSIKAFNTVRQRYHDHYAHLPDNDWGTPENLPPDAQCLPN